MKLLVMAIAIACLPAQVNAGPVADARSKWHEDSALQSCAPSWPTYPTRRSNWSHPGSIRAHIMQGEHAGLFDAEWIATQSDASLRALHSDAHEGRVKWEFVVRAKPTAKMPTVKSQSGCPNGVCPQGSFGLGLFRRRGW